MLMKVLKPLLSFFKTIENRWGRGGPAAETILPWADPSTPPPRASDLGPAPLFFSWNLELKVKSKIKIKIKKKSKCVITLFLYLIN